MKTVALATVLLAAFILCCEKREAPTATAPAAAPIRLTTSLNSLDREWLPEELEVLSAAQTLDRFHEAASKADFDTYFAAWTDDSVFLGTDATERWVGDQFKDFARPIFAKGKGWTYLPHDRHITMMSGGSTVYFDELLDNAKLGLCRGSGVLAKKGDDWKVLQYNLSIPIPNDLAEDFAKRIKDAPKPPSPAPKPADTGR